MLEQLASRASWYQKIGNLYRRLIVNAIIKKSDKLITVSNFEKQNISKIYNLDDTKIRTVHNGVNKNFTSVIDINKKQEIKELYNLPERFLFHFGNTDPRKNTARVLKAFDRYLKTKDSEIKLVLAGLNEDNLHSILKEIDLIVELRDNIVLTGYVADKDLPVIFNLSEVFLFPSLREGFGIPIIEAMACGVAVITSNTSSMPEVAGDAACLINPNSTESIYNAIDRVLTDLQYKDQLIRNGFQQCTNFSWENMAKNVLEVYNQFY